MLAEPDPDTSITRVIARVADGDRSAFAQLYDALAPRVYGVVLRVLRDPAMSEEVTQEVFLEIWRTAARFDPQRASAAGWATMIARRRAVDRVRGEQSLRTRHERAADGAGTTEAPDPAAATIERDEVVRLHHALDELPDDQRMVVRMAFLDGRTHAEIAERLDLPLGTVKGRIRLGLARLSRHLADARPGDTT